MINFVRLTGVLCLALASFAVGPGASAGTPGQAVYTFSLRPGASKTISIPKIGEPLRLTGVLTAKNGGTQTPTNLVAALVSEDPTSFQVTWIGTNGDGSQTVGNTLQSAQVAAFAFSNAVVTAAPGTSTTPATLTFTQSAGTTSIVFYYTVLIDY